MATSSCSFGRYCDGRAGVVISTIVSVMSLSIMAVMSVTDVEMGLSAGELGVFDGGLVVADDFSFPNDVSSHVSPIDRLPIVLLFFDVGLFALSVGIVDGISMIVDELLEPVVLWLLLGVILGDFSLSLVEDCLLETRRKCLSANL